MNASRTPSSVLAWAGRTPCREPGEGNETARVYSALGGAALMGPFEARAQQTLPPIGILHEGLPAPLSLTVAIQQGLIEGGISQGSSVKIENSSAEGQYDRLSGLAADLINRRAGIIVAAYLVAASSGRGCNSTVPIVFITGSDPVAAGLVSSLNRPTGNATGIAFLFTRLGEKNLSDIARACAERRCSWRTCKSEQSQCGASGPRPAGGRAHAWSASHHPPRRQ